MASWRDRLQSNEPIDLEATLRQVGRRAAFPSTPDLWPGIERDLRTEPARPAVGGPLEWLAWPRPWRLAAVVATLLLVLLATIVLVPDLRRVVADRLGLPGIDIQFLDEPPAVATAPAGAALDLGEAVSRANAVERSGFPLKAPTAPGLDEPAIYVTYGPENPMVSFVYPANDLLPASRFTGVGALLTQFEGTVERGLISKGLMDDAAISATSVHGDLAFWIDGAAHTFMYLDPAGQPQSEAYRLASNVLLWEADGITYRLESELTREAAIVIAESMQPVSISGTN